MLNFDFSPLFRTTVGFENLMNLVESMEESATGYPPYNIVKTGDDAYRITMAVAGFSEDDLTVEVRENTLYVTGRKKAPEQEFPYLHRGIAGRAFERRFELAEYIKVVSASLKDGLLDIDLVRELPEAMKPRRIEIATTGPSHKQLPKADIKDAARAA